MALTAHRDGRQPGGDDTATPQLWFVHADRLNRPVMMTDGAMTPVWEATWWSYGGAYGITGPASLDLRLPGQWFQAESGLHYNWHRTYDPQSGRYLQPDPLGMPDGPNRWWYAKNSPEMYVDLDGRFALSPLLYPVIGAALGGGGNLLYQLYQHDGAWECVDPSSVAMWALTVGSIGHAPSMAGRFAHKSLAANPFYGRDANHAPPKPPHVGVHRSRLVRDVLAPRQYNLR